MRGQALGQMGPSGIREDRPQLSQKLPLREKVSAIVHYAPVLQEEMGGGQPRDALNSTGLQGRLKIWGPSLQGERETLWPGSPGKAMAWGLSDPAGLEVRSAGWNYP